MHSFEWVDTFLSFVPERESCRVTIRQVRPWTRKFFALSFCKMREVSLIAVVCVSACVATSGPRVGFPHEPTYRCRDVAQRTLIRNDASTGDKMWCFQMDASHDAQWAQMDYAPCDTLAQHCGTSRYCRNACQFVMCYTDPVSGTCHGSHVIANHAPSQAREAADCSAEGLSVCRTPPAPPRPICRDDPTYFDVWSCSEWAGHACRQGGWGIDTPQRVQSLVRACAASCVDVDC